MLSDIERLIVRDLEGFQREIELFPTDELVWATRPGIANSAGNLAMHVCGGLQHFVGSVLGGTGYVRDRDAEFSRRAGTRAEIAQELAKTIAVVKRTLGGPAGEWVDRPLPIEINGLRIRTGLFLMHLATHVAFHLGQAGYVRRVLTEDTRSAGPIPLAPLADLGP